MASPFPPYPAITRATLRQSLLDRLNSAQFWTTAELNAYITEALYVWQAHAKYWRTPVTFNTSNDANGNPKYLYDLSEEVPQLAYTVTDAALLSVIEYHLLEPQSGIPSNPTWIGTAMFPQDAYTDALGRRRNRFLLETQSVIGHYSASGIAPGTSRVVLPSSVIDVHRVDFVQIPVIGNPPVRTLLWRDDEFAANAYAAEWMTTAGLPTPTSWSPTVTQPYTIQLIPPPGDAGSLDILAIAQGAPLAPTTGVPLGIPDNFAWAIKFGAMADLLAQDGAGTDIPRASYCESRYREGVMLCKAMPSIINAAVNGNAVQLDSITNLDAYSPGWNNSQGVPQVIGLAGDILATGCVPSPVASIALDIVGNCPVPTNDATPINLTADQAEIIVDEAQHLAMFKEGGAEFDRSVALHKNLIQAAERFRRMSLARAPYWPDMAGSGALDFTQTAVEIG